MAPVPNPPQGRKIILFKRKYHNLQEVRYYEGIATDDLKKRKMFEFLGRKGYMICSLERKSYNTVETISQKVKCPKCGNELAATFTKEHKMMKSNVDVYLASDMLVKACSATSPVLLVLVSCDGDYAEMIKNAISQNENVYVVVLATPGVKDMRRNTPSIRLRQLFGKIPRYELVSIKDIQNLVASDCLTGIKTKKERARSPAPEGEAK